MKIGDLDIANAIINLEVQVLVQEKLLEKLMNLNATKFTQSEIDAVRTTAKETVKKKYPELGIVFNS